MDLTNAHYNNGTIHLEYLRCKVTRYRSFNDLWEACRGLVNFNRLMDTTGLNTTEDLESIAMAALARAVENYRPRRYKTKFATYVAASMHNAVYTALKQAKCKKPLSDVEVGHELLEQIRSCSFWDSDEAVNWFREQIRVELVKHKKAQFLVPIYDAKWQGRTVSEISAQVKLSVEMVRRYTRQIKGIAKVAMEAARRRIENELCTQNVSF